MKIIFDCDPGHDDIFALCALLAHPERFDLLGCTTVAGNQTVEKVTDNLLRVLSYLHHKVDVSVGAPCSLDGRTFVQPVAHGESGMDGPKLPESELFGDGVGCGGVDLSDDFRTVKSGDDRCDGSAD
jgi:pyrimidine-specific ribonucleoside hydrolase